MKNIDSLFMRLAAAWFVIGVALGIGMAASHKHGLLVVHAHINLLGWVSMALFAAFYRAWPKAAASPLAKWHLWLYAPAHAVMMVTLTILYLGMPAIEPVLALASMVVGVAIVCFAVLVWKHTASTVPQAPSLAPDAARAS
jgi:hypothetical protein